MVQFESLSTWRQPVPRPLSEARAVVIADMADEIVARGLSRLRVCIDGRTGAGKTNFGHELAAAIRAHGRPTLRACLDDFKRPWSEADELGYDRLSGDGYYRNAWDFAAVRDLLLTPAGPDGTGQVVLCARDPTTQQAHTADVVDAPADAVLIVDGVFAMRSEFTLYWEYRIWLEVDTATALARGIRGDEGQIATDEALRLHRDRYQASEDIYMTEVHPMSLADSVIDNCDLSRPQLVRP